MGMYEDPILDQMFDWSSPATTQDAVAGNINGKNIFILGGEMFDGAESVPSGAQYASYSLDGKEYYMLLADFLATWLDMSNPASLIAIKDIAINSAVEFSSAKCHAEELAVETYIKSRED